MTAFFLMAISVVVLLVLIFAWREFRKQRIISSSDANRFFVENAEQETRRQADAKLNEEIFAARSLPFDLQTVIDVTSEELTADPARWHRKSIRVTCEYFSYFEGSFVSGGAAPLFPQGTLLPTFELDKIYEFRCEGLWIFPRAPFSDQNSPGFGHLGVGNWGEFRIHKLLSPITQRISPISPLVS